MSNNELTNYINQQRAAGVDDATIKSGLQQAGWDEASVNEAFGFNAPVPTNTAPVLAYNQTGGLSFWQKIIMSATDPMGLFRWSRSESVNSFVTFVVILFGTNLILSLVSQLITNYKMSGLLKSIPGAGLAGSYASGGTLRSILLTLIVGPLAFLIITWVVYWFCRLFKGVGSYLDTVRVLVYSSGVLLLVSIVSTLLTVISLSFSSNITNPLQLGSSLGFFGAIISLISFVMMIVAFWTLYNDARGLAEVHGITKGKALAAILIPGLVVALISISLNIFLYKSSSVTPGMNVNPFGLTSNQSNSEQQTAKVYCDILYPGKSSGQTAYDTCLTNYWQSIKALEEITKTK